MKIPNTVKSVFIFIFLCLISTRSYGESIPKYFAGFNSGSDLAQFKKNEPGKSCKEIDDGPEAKEKGYTFFVCDNPAANISKAKAWFFRGKLLHIEFLFFEKESGQSEGSFQAFIGVEGKYTIKPKTDTLFEEYPTTGIYGEKVMAICSRIGGCRTKRWRNDETAVTFVYAPIISKESMTFKSAALYLLVVDQAVTEQLSQFLEDRKKATTKKLGY